jgi:hypothetical protein
MFYVSPRPIGSLGRPAFPRFFSMFALPRKKVGKPSEPIRSLMSVGFKQLQFFDDWQPVRAGAASSPGVIPEAPGITWYDVLGVDRPGNPRGRETWEDAGPW